MGEYKVGIGSSTPCLYIRNLRVPAAQSRWYLEEDEVRRLIEALEKAREALLNRVTEWEV